ncbi:MAG TPA: response regulator, partial [Candidatus Dormibacteraeota bacterium]|nr:response regulator [Candidatus Dormibacteraeota bacterium]
KAEQLEITSRYKSEFLDNMSHELRTPLNSLLILAQELADNPDGNLLPKQTEYATIIRSSGTDLLKLINDILDLSKIESGTVALEITDWPLSQLPPLLERTFRHVAEATKIGFTIDLRPGLPKSIPTDPQRLQQVLNNLLSNAFKFTEKGHVDFRAELVTSGWSHNNEVLNRAETVIAMSVTDTGIGIPHSQQHTIFEAFAQGDGTTSRKYGGTGLGLSICRELTRLLAGEITLESEPGVGSTFTLFLPIGSPVVAWSGAPTESSTNGSSEPVTTVSRRSGASSRNGTRSAPALAVLDSPETERLSKSVLVVEDEPVQRQHILEVMGPIAQETVAVATGEQALAVLEKRRFDCIVIDLGLPGMSGWQLIDHLRGRKDLRSTPVLVYTAKELSRKDELKLGKATKTIVIKEVRSPERLRDEVGAILAKDGAEVMDSGSLSVETSLAGRRVLVVDDDVRNIFALTALLERQGMDVLSVDSGADALETLRQTTDIDIALVDVMMPEMDGYATMSSMRHLPSFEERPIIALTAKAMKGDREKCIEAGASDYIAKPVDSSNLVAMLRSWLSH